jgi:lipoyl(octanoyl) transferase
MSDLRWRLIQDGAMAGAWNMAVDEVLLQGVADGLTPPTLRFYQWSPPCLSLGYFQSFEVVDVDACRALGVDITRRPTGGRAILHDRELTYSLTLPAAVLGVEAGILPSYHRISRALQAGLAQLGVRTTRAPERDGMRSVDQGPICFDRPSAHEILLDGRKLVGSAQVRRGGALLQHGSILIEPRMEGMLACLHRSADSASLAALNAGVAGLAEVGSFTAQRIATAISEAVSAEFGTQFVHGRLDRTERAEAAALMSSKYQSPAWLERFEPLEKTTRTR